MTARFGPSSSILLSCSFNVANFGPYPREEQPVNRSRLRRHLRRMTTERKKERRHCSGRRSFFIKGSSASSFSFIPEAPSSSSKAAREKERGGRKEGRKVASEFQGETLNDLSLLIFHSPSFRKGSTRTASTATIISITIYESKQG